MKELIRFSLKRRFLNSATFVLYGLMFVIFGGLFFSDELLNWINPDMFKDQIIYLNQQDELSLALKDYEIPRLRILYEEKEAKKLLEDDPKAYVLTFEEGYKLYSNYALDESIMATLSTLLTQIRQSMLLSETLPEEQAILMNEEIEISNEVIHQQVELDSDKQNLLFMVITSIYFTMLSCSTSVANEVIYEKSTRQLELILTSVSAKKHFISKILVGWLAILMQCMIMILLMIFWFVIRHIYDGGKGLIQLIQQLDLFEITQDELFDFILSLDINGTLLIKIIFILIFLMLGILLTQMVLSVFSSFISSIENASAIQSPFYVILMLVYYFALSVNTPYQMSEGIGYICSFIPFLSMLFMPCRLMIQNVSLYELILSAMISTLTMLMVMKNGIVMYERGVLDHSQITSFWQIIKKNRKLERENQCESGKIKEYS